MQPFQASLLLGMIAFASGLTVEASRAGSSCESPRHWETYIVERFGTRIEVPVDCFQQRTEIQDGWLFETADGKAKLAVYGSPNADDRDPRSLKRWLVEEVGGYDRVTYSPMGKTWLVLSGYRKGDIFYEKYLLSDHGQVLNSFWMTFPRSAKPVFSPLIERVEDSFRSGG